MGNVATARLCDDQRIALNSRLNFDALKPKIVHGLSILLRSLRYKLQYSLLSEQHGLIPAHDRPSLYRLNITVGRWVEGLLIQGPPNLLKQFQPPESCISRRKMKAVACDRWHPFYPTYYDENSLPCYIVVDILQQGLGQGRSLCSSLEKHLSMDFCLSSERPISCIGECPLGDRSLGEMDILDGAMTYHGNHDEHGYHSYSSGTCLNVRSSDASLNSERQISTGPSL
jgi:hypothetical protein